MGADSPCMCLHSPALQARRQALCVVITHPPAFAQARTIYTYFNYRTGSGNDLLLLILLNLTILLVGAFLRHFLVHKSLPGGATPTLGQDLYRACHLLTLAQHTLLVHGANMGCDDSEKAFNNL